MTIINVVFPEVYGGGGREGNKGHILQIEMTEIHEIRSSSPSLSLRRYKTRLSHRFSGQVE